MKKFLFKTVTTMKDYNRKKWWIDKNYVTDKYIFAGSLNEALEKYRNAVYEQHYIWISDNALKTRIPMYVYTLASHEEKQVGFVITGQTNFESTGRWSKQYIEMRIQILTIEDTEF